METESGHYEKAELNHYEAILAVDAQNPGADGEIIAAAQEIVNLDRDPGYGPFHARRLDDLRKKISHTKALGPAGLRAKAIAARIHSNGFGSLNPQDQGDGVEDLAFSLAGDLLGLPNNCWLKA